MIMSKSGKKHRETFMYGGGALENVTEYTYLGIPLTNSCNFTRTKHVLKNKGTKVINKLKSLISNSPIKRSITLKLFDQLIRPILTYGSEIWGVFDINSRTCSKNNTITPEEMFEKLPQETIHLAYCKYTLGISSKASNLATRGELGRFPLYIHILNQVVKYLHRIENCTDGSLLEDAYKEKKAQLKLKNSWISLTHRIVNHYGLLEILSEKTIGKGRSNRITLTLETRYKEYWKKMAQASPKLETYMQFKQGLYYEPYLDFIRNKEDRIALTKLRTSNHDLLIERGRYTRPFTQRIDRLCKYCKTDVEDETHFLLKCPRYREERKLMVKGAKVLSLGYLLHTYTKDSIIRVGKCVRSGFDIRKLPLNQPD